MRLIDITLKYTKQKSMHHLIIIILSFLTLNLSAIEAKYSIRASGNVTDIIYDNNLLYVATDIGIIEIFDVNTKKQIKKITLPIITDFVGDEIKPKIFDIDLNSSSNELIIVSQAQGGFSNVHLYKTKKDLVQIIDKQQRFMIKRAMYLNNNEIILGLLSNEIVRFDIRNKKVVYQKQISSYTFSDLCLSSKKTRIVSSDESGLVNVLSTKDGKLIYSHEGENLDNVYKIDYKGNTIATAGQDRRLGIYLLHPFSSYYIESSFLIYSVALSPSGEKVAYLSDEDNNITIRNTRNKTVLTKLEGHSAIVNSMAFVTESAMFTAADERIIYYWEF